MILMVTKWMPSVAVEWGFLDENDTFSIVGRPTPCHTLRPMYVFRVKIDKDGNIERHKTRLVAKGYDQIPGQEYGETYSPLVNKKSLMIIFLTIAA